MHIVALKVHCQTEVDKRGDEADCDVAIAAAREGPPRACKFKTQQHLPAT